MKKLILFIILLAGFCYGDIIKIDDQTIEESVTTTETAVKRYDIKRLKLEKQNIVAAINKLKAEKDRIQALIDAAKLLNIE
jgi:hypothetical protein